MMIIENKYDIEQFVYLKTDPDQLKRQVCAIIVYKNGECLYKLCCGVKISDHYDFEISLEEDVTVKM